MKTASKLHNVGMKERKNQFSGRYAKCTVYSEYPGRKKYFYTCERENKRHRTCIFFLQRRMEIVAYHVAHLRILRMIPSNSIDYIFVDPPFGDNLIYSELSFYLGCVVENRHKQ